MAGRYGCGNTVAGPADVAGRTAAAPAGRSAAHLRPARRRAGQWWLRGDDAGLPAELVRAADDADRDTARGLVLWGPPAPGPRGSALRRGVRARLPAGKE